MSSGQRHRFHKQLAAVVFRGVSVGPNEQRRLEGIVAGRPGAMRDDIGREVCRSFGWVRPNGEPPLRACTGLLLGLERKGLLRLPMGSEVRVAKPARKSEPGAELLLQAASAPWPRAEAGSAPLVWRPILEPELVGWQAYM